MNLHVRRIMALQGLVLSKGLSVSLCGGPCKCHGWQQNDLQRGENETRFNLTLVKQAGSNFWSPTPISLFLTYLKHRTTLEKFPLDSYHSKAQGMTTTSKLPYKVPVFCKAPMTSSTGTSSIDLKTVPGIRA